jgi:hypothetical protein
MEWNVMASEWTSFFFSVHHFYHLLSKSKTPHLIHGPRLRSWKRARDRLMPASRRVVDNLLTFRFSASIIR